MSEFETSMSVPLDDDGFLRRACPTCEREFKWINSEEGESEPAADEGYFCPYCGVQAGTSGWWTHAQIDQMQSIVYKEAVKPELEKLKRSVEQMGSGGLIQARVEISGSDPPPELTEEPNDMRRVDFTCHPREPVKVAEDWSRPVYCLVCGTPATS